MELENKNKQTEEAPYDLSTLAEAMLLVEKRLPVHLPEDLQTLRRMLEDAVKGEKGTETPAPVPPGYGKTAYPGDEGEQNGCCMRLREDTVNPFPASLTALSPRQDGVFVTVPQVVGQGGNT